MTKTIATPALRVGDYVWNCGGRVLAIAHDKQTRRYTITFQHGGNLECSRARTWLVSV